MKTTKILASAFIFFALNVNCFATDTSDKLLNSIETNKSDIASALNKNGRNQHLRTHQDNTVFQFAAYESNEVTSKVVMSKSMSPKGRNLEAIDSNEENNSSYANTGRNNKMANEMISMN